jgi:8-oxo-dGTP diphosphatase
MSKNANSSLQLAAFTMILLRHDDRYLMLRRSSSKRFAPNRWTGIGGKVESNEFDELTRAALREIAEETGIEARQIRNLTLRRSIIQHRPGHPITVLLYFTGDVAVADVQPISEGTLHWLTESELESIDIIENTATVIPLLINEMDDNPMDSRSPVLGLATFDEAGTLQTITWESDSFYEDDNV